MPSRRIAILVLATLYLALFSTDVALAARLNPDGTSDPSGCGSFVTSRGDRNLQFLNWVGPPVAIGAIAAATAWFAYREMQDATAGSRQRWAMTVGIALATTIASAILTFSSLFFIA